jgi:GntR family transcriptional regulator / MocR family aminotransferase
LRIPIDRQSDIPIYKQIEDFLREGILSGSLEPETRLPATRKLARDLGVNRITVGNAYAELEADGLICSRVGSGTYVLPPWEVQPISEATAGGPWPLWQQDLQKSDWYTKIDRLLKLIEESRHPDPISFSSGVSDPQRFPVDEFRKVIQNVLRRDGISALEYGDIKGYAPLRSTIAHILASQGVQISPEHILITSGSQQALALVTQLLLNQGDVILVESPTYPHALGLFADLGLKIVGIPIDENGMQVEKLERLLMQHHPKLIYTIPNFQNPSGTCLSGQRRRQLISLADRHNVPILEDDYVGDLRYEGRAQPALKALDPGGRVIYTNTFSKMLMPGLRIGFLAAEGPVYDRLVAYKSSNDLTTSNLIQRALYDFVTVGRYQAHLNRSCQAFRKRRDAMMSAIRHYMPAGVQVYTPRGGLFAWLRLPGKLSSDQLITFAVEEGVSFTPGTIFFPDGSNGEDFMRLNFSIQTPEKIQEGMRRLRKAIDRMAVRGLEG